MSYRNTLQADALKLVAKKLQSSLAVEGELPEDGLAAYGDDGDDLMMALARRVVSGDEEDADDETVEEVFAQARDAEAAAEELLVDDGWKAVESLPRAGHGVEPETVESLPRTGYGVNGNGTNGHHANGHDDLFGPTVEMVPASGHRDDGEADEPQRSLFSWAEFMAEEPVKPKRKNGKTQPSTMSMFEWAMDLEREGETVGAER